MGAEYMGENTLNTLRYAYRVKELKSENEKSIIGKALSRNASEPNLNSYRGISRPNTAKRKRKPEIKKNSKKKNNQNNNNRVRAKPNYQSKRGRKEENNNVPNKKFKIPSPRTKKKKNDRECGGQQRESISEQFENKKNNESVMDMDVDEKVVVPVVEKSKYSKKQL